MVRRQFGGLAAVMAGVLLSLAKADEPPNPFAAATKQRSDAVAGWLELSDGSIVRGKIWLTRGHALRLFDRQLERVREVPLAAVTEIGAIVEKEWLEKEWRFKENASDEKVFTGRSYPVRLFQHEIKLKRGGSVKGALAAVVYVEPDPASQSGKAPKSRAAARKRPAPAKSDGSAGGPLKFSLHKRDKGDFGQKLAELGYVRRIVLGSEPPPEPAAPAEPGRKK